MRIQVNCEAPKYASGKHEFKSFEDLYHWLLAIKGLAKGSANIYLYSLAEKGFYRKYARNAALEIESDFSNRTLAREVALNTGLLGSREKFSRNPDVGLDFVKELDRRILALR